MSPPRAPQGDFGLYVHTPWCKSRCPYCAFVTYVEASPPYERWRDGILSEWAVKSADFDGPAHSLFFGGGTPSLAPAAVIGAIIGAMPLSPGAEVTVEANPGTLSAAHLADLRGYGVNRVSVGLQTFNPRFAHLLNRGHTVHEAQELLQLVAEAGFESWSVDLIFALPGQTLTDFEVDLAGILAASPPHVSLYGLTFEEGTPLTRAKERGQLAPVDDEVWRAMYLHAVATLGAHGYERYEVSNFRKQHHAAVHNEAVWRGGFYAGLGPGAHGFHPDGRRTRGHATFEAWLADPWGEVERPDAEAAAYDRVLTTLRHTDGLDLEALEADLGFVLRPSALASLLATGLAHRRGPALRLRDEGWPLADTVLRKVIDGLRRAAPGPNRDSP